MWLVRKAATRDRDILASNVAAFIRGKERDECCDSIGNPEFGRQDMPLDNIGEPRNCFAQSLGQDHAGCDRVAADVLQAVLRRDIFGHRNDRTLGGTISNTREIACTAAI